AVLHLAGGRKIPGEPDADGKQHDGDHQPGYCAATVVAIAMVRIGHETALWVQEAEASSTAVQLTHTRRISIPRRGARGFIGTTRRTGLRVVRIPPVLGHCHSGPRVGLAIWVGYAKEIERATATQVSAAAIKLRILRFQGCPVIAATPHPLTGKIGR